MPYGSAIPGEPIRESERAEHPSKSVQLDRFDYPAVISRVELQKKRRNRVNVYFGDEFAFGLSLPVAQEAGLRRGLSLDASDVQKLLSEEQQRRAYESALRFLSYRPRSEAEIRTNLRRKSIAPELVDVVVTRLKTAGLIDDAAYARFWVENRDSFSPRGARALRFELRGKGLPTELIQEVLEERQDESEEEEARAYAAGVKKARHLRSLDYPLFRQRLGGYLARRGFDYEAATAAVEALWRDLATLDPENS